MNDTIGSIISRCQTGSCVRAMIPRDPPSEAGGEIDFEQSLSIPSPREITTPAEHTIVGRADIFPTPLVSVPNLHAIN